MDKSLQHTPSLVSVIIATLCESKRKDGLLRAIASVRNQRNIKPEIFIIVNGTRFDPDFFESLKMSSDLNVFYVPEGSFPLAIWTGRTKISSKYFAFIDDDDEFFSDTFEQLIEFMEKNETIDLAVSNGAKSMGGIDYPIYKNMDDCRIDPMGELFKQTWLNSSCGIYRTESIAPDYFLRMEKYFEWTSLGFILAQEKKIHFRDEYFNRIYDTMGSLSKSKEYFKALVPFLEKINQMELSPELRLALFKKLSNAYHDLSDYHRGVGEKRKAWRYHLLSLKGRFGYRYLLYTRRLFL